MAYSFGGRNAPVRFKIYNNFSSPIFINWKESGIELADTHPLSSNLKLNVASNTNGKIDFARFRSDPDALTTVAANSSNEQQIIELSNFNFHKIKKSKFTAQYTDSNHSKKYSAINYSELISPLRFKIFLSVHVGSKNAEPIIINNDFYI